MSFEGEKKPFLAQKLYTAYKELSAKFNGFSIAMSGTHVDKAELVPYFAELRVEHMHEISKNITLFNHVRSRVDQLLLALDEDQVRGADRTLVETFHKLTPFSLGL